MSAVNRRGSSQDVARTRVRDAAARAALRRVLVAYAARNPTLGYCQAMNFVGAALLDALNGDEVGWLVTFNSQRVRATPYSETVSRAADPCVWVGGGPRPHRRVCRARWGARRDRAVSVVWCRGSIQPRDRKSVGEGKSV